MTGKSRGKRLAVNIAGLLAIVLLLAMVAGCAGNPKEVSVMEGSVSSPAAEMPDMGAAEEEMAGENSMGVQAEFTAQYATNEGSAGEAASAMANSQRRYMVKRSHLTIEIADLEEAAESIRTGIEETGGYIASVNFYDLNRGRRWGELSLRVPADKYSQVMLWLQEQGEIRNLEESAEDVTRQYIDLEARIGNLAAQEKRICELLDKAINIEEILQIEKELTRIRSDLESMQGDFKYLRERVTFSTIEVSLVEIDPRESTVSTEFDTFGKELSRRFALNTNRAIKGLTGLVLTFLGSLPFLLPLAILAFALWKGVVYLKIKKKDRNDPHP
ncbi:MAG TPA: DUF4349 domain-containing protein [Firmicutes bacterium]|jgi:hypothetical protein|nr:DUF4349 domain-containing protein [Bacillota bacterium]